MRDEPGSDAQGERSDFRAECRTAVCIAMDILNPVH